MHDSGMHDSCMHAIIWSPRAPQVISPEPTVGLHTASHAIPTLRSCTAARGFIHVHAVTVWHTEIDCLTAECRGGADSADSQLSTLRQVRGRLMISDDHRCRTMIASTTSSRLIPLATLVAVTALPVIYIETRDSEPRQHQNINTQLQSARSPPRQPAETSGRANADTVDSMRRNGPRKTSAGAVFNNTFVITLGRDAVRMAHVRNQTERVFPGASIFWAIDGKSITSSQISQWQKEGYLINASVDTKATERAAGAHQLDPKTSLGKAKIGCFMSHVRLWERLAAEPADDAFYMILEDDIIPSDDFHTRYPLVLTELADQPWDWVHLHVHPKFRAKNNRVIKGKQLINRAIMMWGAHGYASLNALSTEARDREHCCSLT